MRRRRTAALLTLFLSAYLAGYALARHRHWIVHRVGFYTNAQLERRVMDHAVVPGDFGVPAIAPRSASLRTFVAWAYLPIRQLETFAWLVLVPRHSEWPAAQESPV